MTDLLKIGELAKQTGLSIRTLHYYDEIGLLSASQRTGAGHRLYSEQDIIRLQQIVSLRQLGFALSEIHECLASPDYALPQVIELHLVRIREQMALSHTLVQRLSAIATELKNTQSVAVSNLIEAMETISMSEQYFTPQQQAVLEARFQERESEWQDMLTLARSEMSKGSALNSIKVQALAHYWQLNMKSLICGDEQIYQSFAEVYQKEGAEVASWGTMDAATFDYILKAIAFASLADDIDWHISDQNYTPDAINVIHLGQETAHKLNLGVFGTEAMLLGFLAEGASQAAQVLTTSGVMLDTAQHQIVELLGARPTPPIEIPVPSSLPFAPRVKRVLELAREQVDAIEQAHVAPEHLLIGILKETEEIEAAGHAAGVAARVLREGFGIDLAHLEQQLTMAEKAGATTPDREI
ncbi:MAG: MerR family transcriptional regulator [Cyanobacteria bacterium P01_A01_bin.137]